jgi:hypothetical protein
LGAGTGEVASGMGGEVGRSAASLGSDCLGSPSADSCRGGGVLSAGCEKRILLSADVRDSTDMEGDRCAGVCSGRSVCEGPDTGGSVSTVSLEVALAPFLDVLDDRVVLLLVPLFGPFDSSLDSSFWVFASVAPRTTAAFRAILGIECNE